MLYYVRSGDLDVSLHAKSHREAAIKTIGASKENLGICVIVSRKEIKETNASSQVYFLTNSILEDCEDYEEDEPFKVVY